MCAPYSRILATPLIFSMRSVDVLKASNRLHINQSLLSSTTTLWKRSCLLKARSHRDTKSLIMSLRCLTACTLFLCFVTSCEAAEKPISEMIQEAAKALEKDWKSESDVIIHLIDKVAKLEKLLGSCEKRVKDVDKKILVFQESQNIVKIDVTQLDSKLSQCCSQPSTGTCQHQHLLIIDWDDSGQLFLNGNEINDLKNANNRYDLDAVMLPIDAKVIAVKGTNKDDDDAGILASSSDGFISTNTSWKCSKEYEKGWAGVDFDDSKWPQASVVTSANNKPIVGISHHASWIWTDNYKPDNGDKEVFCRLKLP